MTTTKVVRQTGTTRSPNPRTPMIMSVLPLLLFIDCPTEQQQQRGTGSLLHRGCANAQLGTAVGAAAHERAHPRRSIAARYLLRSKARGRSRLDPSRRPTRCSSR